VAAFGTARSLGGELYLGGRSGLRAAFVVTFFFCGRGSYVESGRELGFGVVGREEEENDCCLLLSGFRSGWGDCCMRRLTMSGCTQVQDHRSVDERRSNAYKRCFGEIRDSRSF
jgi:hypothetical protein